MPRNDRVAKATMVLFFSLGAMAVGTNAQQSARGSNGSEPGKAPQAAQPGKSETGAVRLAGKWTFHTVKVPFDGRLIGITDSGEVLGSGFVYRNGDTTVPLLKNPGEGPFIPVAINNKNQVLTGQNQFGDGFYLYNSIEKTISPISPNAQIKGGNGAIPNSFIGGLGLTGFNDVGQFIGTSSVGGNEIAVYGTLVAGRPGSKMSETTGLGSLTAFGCPGEAQTKPTAINNHGQIVGTCKGTQAGQPALSGFLYNIATATMTLFSYPGALITEPRAINDSGLIAGDYQPSTSIRQPVSFGFIYDGSQFAPLMPPGAEASKRRTGNYIPLGMNNHGDVVGSFGRNGFIATVGERSAPQAAEMWSLNASPKRAYRHPAKPGGPIRDPNLPGIIGDPGSMGVPIGWNYGSNIGTIPSELYLLNRVGRDPVNYLGFDDVHGSIIESQGDRYVYAYNGKTRTLSWIAKGIYDLPEDVVAGLKNPSNTLREMRGESEVSAAEEADQILQQAHGENGAITTGADGKSILTYVLNAPASADHGKQMTFAVVRPVKAPSTAQHQTAPPTGNTGNWLWIGEGEQQGYAAMFTLDSGGIVKWNFLDPHLAAEYQGKASPGALAQGAGAPSAAQTPGDPGEITGTGATVQSGILTFTLANRSKATYRVVRPKVSLQATGITGKWISLEEGGNGILFTVQPDGSVSGREMPAAVIQMLR